MQAAHRLAQGGAYGVPLMKLTLTFDGKLPPCGNSNRRPEEKWRVRQHVSPQLKELWELHPTLKDCLTFRHIPKNKLYWWQETHHQATNTQGPRAPDLENDLDTCAEIEVSGYRFRPLIRDTLGLVCSLNVLFLRKGQIGNVYEDGDLDNRVKTLFDGLQVPTSDQIEASKPADDKGDLIYCLLENDRLITGFNIETRQLLNRPGGSDFDVHLVVDVDIRVTHPRAYNRSFMGD